MGFEDYISEHEAVNVSGVSASTLRRFAETGYLQIETDNDGVRLYSKAELRAIFAVDPDDVSDDTPLPGEMQRENATPVMAESMAASEAATGAPSAADASLAGSIEIERAANTESSGPAVLFSQSAQSAQFTDAEATTQTLPAQEENEPQTHEEARVSEASDASGESSKRIRHLEKEVTRFRNMSDMLERILDLREKELDDVRKERNWLRTRIERFEEKQERDQLLLLAETQTIRKLINNQEPRRTPFSQLLEWLGFGETGPSRLSKVVALPEGQPQTAAAESDIHKK